MDRDQVVHILNEIGTLLEIQGENPFKCIAYRNAARALEGLHEDLAALVADGRLQEVKGVGSSIAGKIATLVATGALPYHEELRSQVPPGVLELMRVSGLGPKKARILWLDLGILSLDALEQACRENRLLAHAGFGQKTQENILQGLVQLRSSVGKFLYHVAAERAEKIRLALEANPAVRRVSTAGSLRRRKEIVKDLDLLVATADAPAVMEQFVHLPEVERILAQGPTRSSVVLPGGLQADLRAVSEAEFPFALHYFTGSKEHNTAVRGRARRMGLKLNEYGLHREDGTALPCSDEAALYRALGLAEIPPELREDLGEIESAEQDDLPRLVDEADLRGAFHVHTTWSDGRNSVAEMVAGARARGWRYLGISDHSKSAVYAGGLDQEKLARQQADIDAVARTVPGFRIFKGSEVDILPDGSLDYDEDILSTFDFVVASIHSKFKMTEAEATGRLIRAMENPHVTFLGHPTGRLLLDREGYPVNMHAVIEAAAHLGVAIEINSHPLRLDMDWRLGRFAREKGLRIGIFPDAHEVGGLADVRYGVGIARKAWMRAEDVVNAWELDLVEKWLGRRRSGAGAARPPGDGPPAADDAKKKPARKKG